jgi:ankyrin repeat protein
MLGQLFIGTALTVLDRVCPLPTAAAGPRITEVRRFIDHITVDKLDQLNDGENPYLIRVTEALYGVAEVAAQRELPDPSPDTSASIAIIPSTSSAPTKEMIPRRASNISAVELQDRFEAALSRAKRMYEAQLPIFAKGAYDKAMEDRKAMQSQGIDTVGVTKWIDMEIIHVRIIKACVPHGESYEVLANDRLQSLKSSLREACSPGINTVMCDQQESVGKLCADMDDFEGAEEFLRLSLDTYLSKGEEYAEKIQSISTLICEYYDRWVQPDSRYAFEKGMFRRLGYHPASNLKALGTTIKWCHLHNYTASIVEGRLHITEENYDGNTPLHDAAADTSIELEVMHHLVSLGHHERVDANGDTPLFKAVRHSNNVALGALLRINGSVHIRNTKKETPLHLCDNEETLSLLLKEIKKPVHGSPNYAAHQQGFSLVDVDSEDRYGETALHIACKIGSAKMVGLLVAEGAKVNGVSKSNRTPLMINCLVSELNGGTRLSGKRRRILEILVNHNADTTHNDEGNNAVRKSLKKRGYKSVEIDDMLSPDPTQRLTWGLAQTRSLESTGSGPERPSLTTESVVSYSPSIELAADNLPRPVELATAADVSRCMQPASGYDVSMQSQWYDPELAELPGSTPAVDFRGNTAPMTVVHHERRLPRSSGLRGIGRRLRVLRG